MRKKHNQDQVLHDWDSEVQTDDPGIVGIVLLWVIFALMDLWEEAVRTIRSAISCRKA